MKSSSKLILNPFLIFNSNSQIFLKVFQLLIFLIFASLFLFALFQIIRLTQEVSYLTAMEQRLEAGFQQNENWRLKAAKVDYQAVRESLIKEFNFEKVEKVHFIKVPVGHVASF